MITRCPWRGTDSTAVCGPFLVVAAVMPVGCACRDDVWQAV